MAVERDREVNILAYILMPNHFHLLLEPLNEGGISSFLHKVCMGYTHYFNKKNDRSGVLFQGRFKSVHVESHAQFEHLPRYIHLNALDLYDTSWREGEIKDWDKAFQFVDNYPWSSHHDYMGRKQDLPIITRQSYQKLFETQEDYVAHLRERSIPPPPGGGGEEWWW